MQKEKGELANALLEELDAQAREWVIRMVSLYRNAMIRTDNMVEFWKEWDDADLSAMREEELSVLNLILDIDRVSVREYLANLDEGDYRG